MKQVIDQITDQLVGLIPKDQSTYSPQQLLQAGIPSYIVERVRLLLEDKVLADYQKPHSEWIDTENKLFESSWKDFRSAIFSCSVIPHEKVYEILHNTISDIICVFVEPRKYMALYLFRDEKLLSVEEVTKRCARLTIYKHFGKAIPLYMEKKELNELTLERCQKLIANLDARIVSNYTAENWAQKLELLFTLFGGKLDPKLLETFFKDKGLVDAANVFAQIDVPVTQSTFVEMLSSDKIDFNSVEKEEPEIAKEENNSPAMPEGVEENIESEKEVEENLASAFQVDNSEPDINEILGDIAEQGVVETSNIEEAASLNALFSEEYEEENTGEHENSVTKEEEQKELRSNLSSILGKAKDSLEGVEYQAEEDEEKLIVEEELIEDLVEEPEESEEQVTEDSMAEESSDEEEKPMWAQFLSEDQMEVMMASRDEEEADTDNINEALFVEDEDDELVIEAPQETSNTVPLKGYLHEKEAEWIKALFDGNNKEYHSAVNKIEGLESWEEASEFVETQIFGKEQVDMFSDEAVGFIDVLQTYFKKYKS